MAIEVFQAATEVTVSIDLNDRNGNMLAVDDIEYAITDDDGDEIIARTPLTGFVSGSTAAVITILASDNVIAIGSLKEARTIELFCSVNGNTVTLSFTYILAKSETLIEGVNSFQSMAKAEVEAMDIPNLTQWDISGTAQKVAAMIDARAHIFRLNFSFLNSNVNWGQDSLNYIPEGTYDFGIATEFDGDLSFLNQQQYAGLPERFKSALRKAQIVEANAILGGDTAAEIRASGVIMDNIGDSKQTYRDGAPLQLPICRRALGFLSPFISFSKRIGRS